MAYTRVKICGLTRPEDAAIAAAVGTDAIGLNFYDGPRQIDFDQAVDILAELPPLVSVVALLGINPKDELARPHLPPPLMAYVQYLQLYESPAKIVNLLKDCHCWHLIEQNCFWPVFRIATRDDVRQLGKDLSYHGVEPCGLVVDTAVKGQTGGTGQAFDWNWIAEARAAGELENLPPLILAGGLNPDNVAQAIRIVKPYAVDVSSGVEMPGKPGVKDAVKMRDFVQAVRGAG